MVNLMGRREENDAHPTHDLVVDIHAVQEKFKHYRVSTRGYKGLCTYILFVTLYLVLLAMQHQALRFWSCRIRAVLGKQAFRGFRYLKIVLPCKLATLSFTLSPDAFLIVPFYTERKL